jgi:hypothetical protein
MKIQKNKIYRHKHFKYKVEVLEIREKTVLCAIRDNTPTMYTILELLIKNLEEI